MGGGGYNLAVDGWGWIVVDIFWLSMGGGEWWWIYFGWWWVVVGGGGYILDRGGCLWGVVGGGIA